MKSFYVLMSKLIVLFIFIIELNEKLAIIFYFMAKRSKYNLDIILFLMILKELLIIIVVKSYYSNKFVFFNVNLI